MMMSQLAYAQSYSTIDKVTDSIRLFVSSGDSKVTIALEIREKEVGSAIELAKEGKDASQNLERSEKMLNIVQEKVSPTTAGEVKESVEDVKSMITGEVALPGEFDDYLEEEEKTIITAELTEKTYLLCKQLAQEDYIAMLEEERCDPETAPDGLKKELAEIKDIQNKLFTRLMLEVRSCIDDPGTCDCDSLQIESEKASCRQVVALATRCEYKNDDEACNNIESMLPNPQSFIPVFLMDMFRDKEYMIDYNIQKSDVPPECYNENDKPQCEQYRHLKEGSHCWDENGNFLYDVCVSQDGEPTMEESIPQCFDNGVFKEECGEVTKIVNEEGLVNYIVESEIDAIINETENVTEDAVVEEMRVDIDGLKGRLESGNFTESATEETVVTIEDGEGSTGDQTIEIEEGAGESGEAVVEVVTDEGTESDGIVPKVVTDVAEDGSEGLTTEVVTDVE